MSHRKALVLGAGLAAGFALAASAAVKWESWTPGTFQSVVDRAAAEKKLVLLVVTQPDWCPPCITLDRKWLRNVDDTDLRDLSKDMVVLEVRGYDPEGARLLASQGIRFQGTPTTFVFRPEEKRAPLGRATLLGAVVGAPADYPQKLRALLTADEVAAAAKAVEGAQGHVAKAKALLALARLHAERGEVAQADVALEQVAQFPSKGGASEIARLRREAEWLKAAEVDLRVRKDYAAALKRIDAYIAKHGRPAEQGGIAYSRAWALGNLGRIDDALDELEAHVLSADTPEAFAEYGYYAFRLGNARVLTLAEQVLRAALTRYPDDARLHAELGRVLRRQGRTDEAADAFRRAVELATAEEDKVLYQAQLENVRRERAPAAEEPAAKKKTRRSRSG